MPRIYPGPAQPDTLAGDVAMVLGPNGGDLIFEDGQVRMTAGFKTAAILTMAGGNEDDPGTGDTSRQWWGNIGRPEAEQYRSATGHLLATIPPTSNGLKRIQAAAEKDLGFFLDIGAASEVEAEATMPARGRLDIACRVRADGREETFTFSQNWVAHAQEMAAIDLPYTAGSIYAYWIDNARNLFQDNFGRLFLMGG